MAARVVVVQVELLTIEPGMWCNDCALSSGVLVHYALTVADRTAIARTSKCRDCGGSNVATD